MIVRQDYLCFLHPLGWYSSLHGLSTSMTFPRNHSARFARHNWADSLILDAEAVVKVYVTWRVLHQPNGYVADREFVRMELGYIEARLEPEIEARLEHHFRTYDDIPF